MMTIKLLEQPPTYMPVMADDGMLYAQGPQPVAGNIPDQNYTRAFNPENQEKSVFPAGRAEYMQASANSPIYIPAGDPNAGLKRILFFSLIIFVGFKIYKGVLK